MARTRTKGVTVNPDGTRTIAKQHRGSRIFERLGAVSQEEAEHRLRAAIAEVDEQRRSSRGVGLVFADSAARYLKESIDKATAETIAYHVRLLVPHIGRLPLERVHDATIEPFVAARLRDGVSAVTVNRSLEVARSILTRSARAYRDESGRPWLRTAPPLITMLPEHPREPWPLSWPEQDRLFAELPADLALAAEFGTLAGARDDNLAGLSWQWEQPVPEVGRSVFVVPPERFKGGRRAHVIVLGDRAWEIVQSRRGLHPENVFVWRRGSGPWKPWSDGLNNTAWQQARQRAGLRQVRVHDLRHTYASRLRAAGVSDEDRATLLGHAGKGMPQHYASADIGRLIELANRAAQRTAGATVLRVIEGGRLAQKVAQEAHLPRRTAR